MIKLIRYFSILLFIIFTNENLLAQLLDETYNPNIRSIGYINSTAEQSDGKVILIGKFDDFNGIATKHIIRLNPDGSIDDSFNIGTGPVNDPFVTELKNVKIQTDGKIIITGQFSVFNGINRGRIVRLNMDGSVDNSFTPPENLEQIGSVYSPLSIQEDGKVLYRQSVETNGSYPQKIIRLNSDGTIDTSFNVEFDGSISKVEVWAGGKILVGGNFSNCNGNPVGNFVVLSSTGVIENSFDYGSTNNIINTFAVQPDNKIILAWNNSSLIRLNTDITQDLTFLNSLLNVKSIDIDATGKIVCGGGDGTIWHVNIDGSINNTYIAAPNSYDFVSSIIALSNGKTLAAGHPSSLSKMILRLTDTFLLDTSFGIGTGPTNAGQVQASVVQPDGKIILSGTFTIYDGVEKKGLVRLNADLSIDNTFNIGLGIDKRVGLNFMEIQDNGKVILSGEFRKYNGVPVSGLIRINTDGTLDNSFVATRQFGITCTALQGDNKLVIGRRYSDYIIRLNIDGTVDQSFTPTLNNVVTNLSIQNDGKILAGGNFTTINGITLTSSLARLESNGILDNSFQSAITDIQYLGEIVPLNNGKILLGGSFQNTSGLNNSCIRLLNNGEIDSDFTLSSKTSNTYAGLIFQLNDGSILVNQPSGLIRLLPDGADYSEFIDVSVGSAAYEYVRDVIPLPTSFLAYGLFSKIDSSDKINIAHFTYTPVPTRPLAPTGLNYTIDISGRPILTWTDASNDESGFIISRTPIFSEKKEVNSGTTTFTDLEVQSNVDYTYKVASFNLGGMSNYSNEISIQTGIITSIKSQKSKNVNVYPNPGTGIFTIDWKVTGDSKINILNQQGILIRTINPVSSDPVINISDLSNGIYFIQLVKSNEYKLVYIIKQD